MYKFLILFSLIQVTGLFYKAYSQSLIEYARDGNFRLLDSLLKVDPTLINQADQAGATALHYAVASGDTISARILIQNGADINHKDNVNSTPLVWAVYSGDYDMVKFLLAQKADITYTTMGGNNLLHLATTFGLVKVLELLIDSGIDVNAGNKYAVTPLQIAASVNSGAMTRILLNHGADPTMVCSSGKNAYHYAVNYRSDSVYAILISVVDDPGPIQFPNLSGPYLGMNMPDTIPLIFAPGLLITPFFIHGQIAFSWDLNEMAWSDNAQPVTRIWYMRIINGQWAPPVALQFSKDYYSVAPFFAPQGNRLYFYSERPEKPGEDSLETIWYSENYNQRMSFVVRLPIPGWDGKFVGFPSFSKNNNLYFYSYNYQDSIRQCDLYFSEHTELGYTTPVSIGKHVNSPYHDIEPAIAPDESFLVFTSLRPENIQSNIELYVIFKKTDGSWTPAVNLGPAVNRGGTWRPYITPDGKFLFYNSNQTGIDEYYWVSTKIITHLKQKLYPELK